MITDNKGRKWSNKQLLERCAALEKRIERFREALIWCSGSEDFNDGGKAREGWLKLCAPLLVGSDAGYFTRQSEKEIHNGLLRSDDAPASGLG